MSNQVQPRPSLLIVDDDARVREMAEFAAKRSGIFPTVLLADDGASALALLDRYARESARGALPDAILTDLSMPRTNGFELVESLKREPATKDIPVVMFSSSDVPNDRTKALATGCEAFFEKPKNLTGLTALIRTIGIMANVA